MVNQHQEAEQYVTPTDLVDSVNFELEAGDAELSLLQTHAEVVATDPQSDATLEQRALPQRSSGKESIDGALAGKYPRRRRR